MQGCGHPCVPMCERDTHWDRERREQGRREVGQRPVRRAEGEVEVWIDRHRDTETWDHLPGQMTIWLAG